MAEQKKNGNATQTATNVAEGAKLARDGARLASGDLTAVKDLLLNKYVIGLICGFLILIILLGLIIGASITGVLQYLSATWQENWDKNWENEAVGSAGDLDYLETTGWFAALFGTVADTVTDIYTDITTGGINAGAGTSDNSQIGDADINNAGNNPTPDSYQTTIEAIINNAQLNAALTERLDMIKGRVKQRGLQIQKATSEQYTNGFNSQVDNMADYMTDAMEKYIISNPNGSKTFFAGFSNTLTEENIHVDNSVFEISSLQALKILAIFSIQHDCQLTDMDMWTLMDYCGWYRNDDTGALTDMPDTIYEPIQQTQQFGSDIGDIIKSGQAIPVASFEFPALKVPTWTGTCAPQWYYEELAQIRKHNEQYDKLQQAGKVPEGMISWGDDNSYGKPGTYYSMAASYLQPTYQFPLFNGYLQYTYTYYLYKDGTTLVQTITSPDSTKDLVLRNLVASTNYTVYVKEFTQFVGSDGSAGERLATSYRLVTSFKTEAGGGAQVTEKVNVDQFAALKGVTTYGIIDRLFYSGENNITICRNEYTSTTNYTREQIEMLGTKTYNFWKKYVWGDSKITITGSTVVRDDAGNHSFTYAGVIPEDTTGRVEVPLMGKTFVYETIVKHTVYVTGPNETAIYRDPSIPGNATFTGLAGDTSYTLIQIKETTQTLYTDNEITSTNTASEITTLDMFTTFPDVQAAEAFELYLTCNISFKARTVDEIAFDLLGIWPGDLKDLTQVVRQTRSGNIIGKSADSEQYSYSLSGGIPSLQAYSGTAITLPNNQYLTTKRSTSSYEQGNTLSTKQIIYEYGISDANGLAGVDAVPNDGWKSVSMDGKNIVFPIQGDQNYKVYLRITTRNTTINTDGTTSVSESKNLYLIDEIIPNSTSGGKDILVVGGKLYSDGHLGNENMLLNWTDIYFDPDGTPHNLQFSRMTGYQYESYVDMVMALCELLDVSYDGWEPALSRAEELGLNATAKQDP